ncbi:MAG TPA: Ig-like domain repeat protein [Terriglobales bacterium]|nr:Ig-like domain repeat protein [Terriglobales bacterium]
MKWLPAILVAGSLALAQAPAPGTRAGQSGTNQIRIRTPVQDGVREVLPGGAPLLARRGADLGPLAANRAIRRLLVVLRRGPEQEQDLRQLLREQQDPASPTYHRWLTPREFGGRFGPADADLAVVVNWLQGHGLQTSSVSAGRSVIEVSGSEGQLAAAFGSALHRYRSGGKDFIANASNPTLPAALASVVAGPLSMNNIPRKTTPLFSQGLGALPPHVLVPGDFAKIYNVAPLYAHGITGKGVSIAVVARADYPAAGVTSFRQTFLAGFSAAPPTTFLNGADPGAGTTTGDADEAALDAEWSGAVAPDAAVDFVVSQSTDVTDGVDLSAQYIVDHALAPIMSSSYGACEAALGGPGSAGNLFYQNLYEQAAAEGITVVVSSGDSGAAACDPLSGGDAAQGPGVNGLASTPFNVAVGGTQFNDQSGTYWQAQNSDTLSSVLRYIPELAWNESCSFAACGGFLGASGGGGSLVYAKPSWQTAAGVPDDGARDLPDVSLDASLGIPYAYCQPGCFTPTGLGTVAVKTAAGTSASAQAFASALALLVQKTGSWQGLITPELYQLAAQTPATACNASNSPAESCIFNDITQGSNAVPCVEGSPGCSGGTTAQANGQPAYAAGAGFDLATGLGSVNFANLIAAWPAASPSATQTSLTASAGSITHGQPVTFQASVTSGGATPTGSVEILDGGGPRALVLGTATLQAGEATITLSNLPGGTDSIAARFAGTRAFDPSASEPVTVTVSTEPSQTTLTARQPDADGNWHPAQTIYYGSALALDAAVAGNSGVAASAGGSVAFSLDGEPTGTGAIPLNGSGTAGLPVGLLPLGDHTFGAAFSGDSGLGASTAPPVSVRVQPAATGVVTGEVIADTNRDGSEGVVAFVNVTSHQVELPGTTMGGNVTITDPTGATVATIPISGVQANPPPINGEVEGGGRMEFNVPAGPPLQYTAHYSGDGNFLPSDAAPFSVDDGAFHFTVQQPDVSASPGGTVTYKISVILDAPLPGNTVTLACADGGAFPCALSSTAVTLTPQQPEANFTATVSLAAFQAAGTARNGGGWPWLAMLILGAALLWICRAHRRFRPWALAAALVLATACGGTPSPPPPPPPSQPYSIQVIGTSGIHVNYANMNLTLTP